MTSLYLPSMTSQSSLSSIALQATAVTAVGSEDYASFNKEELLLKNVNFFWSSFPCPPPWRPTLLTEVNSSKLGPQVTQVVTNFLAGKCQLHADFPGTRIGSGFGLDEDGGPFGPNAESHLPENSDDLMWCDRTCQLAIGCSAVLMAMLVATVALVCFTRVRRPHKMASTRPSRQQLQLSTSTSDPINWAEFSNTQIQFDDDMVYPPFRHRGLPSPPSQCHHPSCDPKWNCPTCSSCHPLMRMSPSGTACSHGYSAVYETIDDEEEDATAAGTLPYRLPNYQASEALHNRENNIITESPCSNICYRKSSTPPNDLSRPDDRREAETGFNGDDVNRWPKYFELDSHCDRGHLNAPLTGSRNTGMKSFQSPHQEKWGFHHVLAPNTFGKSPHPVAQTACNQLCATCVPNIVSMVPCVNISRQNGYIPNGKALNISQYQQAIMCVSSVDNNPHHIFNPSSVHNRNIVEVDKSQNNDESRLTENQYFFNQGCDLTLTQSDNSQPVSHIPGVKRLSNEDSNLNSTMWPGIPSNTDSNSQEIELLASPSRHWCPTCQQVPLLDHHSTHINSACGGSDIRARDNSDRNVTLDSQHGLCECQPDSHGAFMDPCNDSNLTAGGNSPAETLQSVTEPEDNFHNPLNSMEKTWLPESPQESMTSTEIQHTNNENFCNPTGDSHPCPRVLALHSRYFNKTSTA